jgi:hypothetical protein
VRYSDLPLIERVLFALREELKSFSESALKSPAQRDAFEYGRVTGHFSGVEKAIQLIEEALVKDNEDDDHGYSRRGETRFTIRN